MWKQAGRPESKNSIYTILRNKSRKEVRTVQRKQAAENRIELHQDIMQASKKNTKLFYKIVNTQRSTNQHNITTLRVDNQDLVNPEDVNEAFCNHFEKLANPNPNTAFDEEHHEKVKLNVELMVNICENENVIIQPVTTDESMKSIMALHKGKSGDCNSLTEGLHGFLDYWITGAF